MSATAGDLVRAALTWARTAVTSGSPITQAAVAAVLRDVADVIDPDEDTSRAPLGLDAP